MGAHMITDEIENVLAEFWERLVASHTLIKTVLALLDPKLSFQALVRVPERLFRFL
jgi:hypothetical protein